MGLIIQINITSFVNPGRDNIFVIVQNLDNNDNLYSLIDIHFHYRYQCVIQLILYGGANNG